MANKAVNKKKKGMNGEELAGMHIYKITTAMCIIMFSIMQATS